MGGRSAINLPILLTLSFGGAVGALTPLPMRSAPPLLSKVRSGGLCASPLTLYDDYMRLPRIGATLAALALLITLSDASVTKMPFGTTKDGRNVEIFTLTNLTGAEAKVMTYGATVTSLRVPDKEGKLGEVVLGFDDLKTYEDPVARGTYLGAIAGRYANRVAKGRFSLDSKEYTLPINNPPNSLHGGTDGYDQRIWKAVAKETKDGPSVVMALRDPAGSNGYPGAVDVTVTYTLTNENALRVEYRATADKATPINLTQHTYFNLKDAGASDVRGHVLMFDADRYLEVDASSIPVPGAPAKVEGTPIDFRTAKPIGQDLDKMGADPAGYDHNLVLNAYDEAKKGVLHRAAVVSEPTSGRVMEMWTTEPGVQLYTGNFLKGELTGRGGAKYDRYHGFCLEAQHFPDSPNRPDFPPTILRPGRPYRQTTEYRFSTER